MFKFLYIFSVLVLLTSGLKAQTCCSGGIPISANISFENQTGDTWQIGMDGDFNALYTLKDGTQILNDDSRQRNIYSVLLRGGYNITENTVAGIILPYIRQERIIKALGTENYEFTQGPGDIILFAQYLLPFSNYQNSFQVGLGSKLPTGPSNLKNQNNISFNMDMQPGTGSADWLLWGSIDRNFTNIPTMTFSTQFLYRLNGVNNSYLGTETYHFGNEWQIIAGISKQLMIKSEIFNTSAFMKVRQMNKNNINDLKIQGTGGLWVYIIPSVVYKMSQNINLSVIPEIPVYTKLNGTQLTTSFRIKLGISYQIGGLFKTENTEIENL